MKKAQKVIALLISMVIVFCSSVALLVPISAATDNTERDVVLIVDTSGSMYYEPIAAAIEAATKFCESVLTGTSNTNIALVSLNTNAEIKSEFTRDISSITGIIKSFNANGGTNIWDALVTADSLFLNSPRKNAQKSIVLMTDGLPENGEIYNASDARYSYDEYGFSYDYASSVYNFAQTLIPKNYNIYTLGFFHSLTGQNLKLGQTLLKDIQNKGYYEVKDIDNLVVEFIKIAQEIMQPLTAKVSYTQKSKVRSIKDVSSTQPTYVNTYTYEIRATITNGNKKDINNATAKLELSAGMQMDTGDATQNISKIEAKGKIDLKWIVKVSDVTDDKNLDFSVAVESDNTLLVTAFGKIFAKGTSSNNNIMIFGKDTWKFRNWGEKEGDKLPISDIDLKALKLNLSNTDKNEIDSSLVDLAGGLCFGMAVSSLLTKVGRVSPADMEATAKSLSDVPKNSAAKSTISYYHLTQKLDEFENHVRTFKSKAIKSRLTEIKDLADKVDIGGNPFILCYEIKIEDDEYAGHAVVAYSFERGNYKKSGKSYNSRILVYDNNSPQWDQDWCLYFNEGTDEWTIPNWENKTTDIYAAFSDINKMDVHNMSSNVKTVNAHLRAKEATDLIVKSASGNVYRINQTNISGDPGAVAYYDILGSGKAGLNILLPLDSNQNDEGYTVSPQTLGTALDLSIKYKNYSMSASAPGAEAVVFEPQGSVGLNGEVKNFNITLTGNEGYTSLPWYTINAFGDSAENPEIKRADEGCILNAKNMKNITVIGINDDETKETEINTDKDSVLIGNLNGELAVYIDEDGDGKYETLIAASDRTIKPNDPSTPTTPEKDEGFPAWAIVLIIFLALILIGGAITLISLLGSKSSNTDSIDSPVAVSNGVNVDFEENTALISRSGKGIATIVILSGSMKGTSIPIKDKETLNLGKDSNVAHIVFADDYKMVSRLHCTISYDAKLNKYFVTDCSTNGTFKSDGEKLGKGRRVTIGPNSTLLLANEYCSILLK